MKDGRCPKCGAAEVHTTRDKGTPTVIRFGHFKLAPFQYYICTHCGYVEHYIDDAEKLASIAQRCPRVKAD